jgi:hypothetical protein
MVLLEVKGEELSAPNRVLHRPSLLAWPCVTAEAAWTAG